MRRQRSIASQMFTISGVNDGDGPVNDLGDHDPRAREPRVASGGVNVFQRIKITETSHRSEETKDCCDRIEKVVLLREKYLFRPTYEHPKETLSQIDNMNVETVPIPPRSPLTFECVDGVFRVYDPKNCTTGDVESKVPEHSPGLYKVHSADEYFDDLKLVMDLTSHGPTRSLAYNRLEILSARFNLHILLNEAVEMKVARAVPHRDFYNIRKVDNHVHHSACMNQKHLLRFIKFKLKTETDTEVLAKKDGSTLTLGQVFKDLNLRPYDLSIDNLDMHAHQVTFHRFDKFNQKYNPVGSSALRSTFLKTDNHIKGRFLAELTHQVFDDLESQKYQHAEYRLSIYGRNLREWDKLAAWVVDNKLRSQNVKWLIQIPRLYEIYKANKMIDSFQDMITNIFKPLFEVTMDPGVSPKLHIFLKQVCGFDSVDDESVPEKGNHRVHPEQWDYDENPPYSYWSYYIYANVYVLNKLREDRGFNTFAFRPHAGEAGSAEHLGATFLVAQSINHGVLLKKHPVLHYLYYITQIGLSVSPLSNNVLFVDHDKNPFPKFFAEGLNITLSTDDPLMIHYTKDPLIEEYSIAAQVWKLSSIDMSEIARNSIYQSGFDSRIKEKWLGSNHERRGVHGNDVTKTNLPNVRIAFRHELHEEELRFISGFALNCDPYNEMLSPGLLEPLRIPSPASATDTDMPVINEITAISLPKQPNGHVRSSSASSLLGMPSPVSCPAALDDQTLSQESIGKFMDLMNAAVSPSVLRSNSISHQDMQEMLNPHRRMSQPYLEYSSSTGTGAQVSPSNLSVIDPTAAQKTTLPSPTAVSASKLKRANSKETESS